MSALYNAVLVKLARRGHRRPPPATPLEYANSLATSAAPGSSELLELTQLYYQVVYGTREMNDALPKAQALSEAIEQAFREARRAGTERESGESQKPKS